jgi:hypothetical protein
MGGSMELSVKDAIDLYQSQIGIINGLWAFFGAVTLAVVGFTIGSERATHSASEVALIISGYTVFAIFGNLTALRMAYADLLQFSSLIENRAALYGQDLPPLRFSVPSVQGVTVFHVGIVIVVAMAIVAYSVFRAHERSKQTASKRNSE